METACDCCQKKLNAKDKLLKGDGEHICKCQTRDENLKIDAGPDQTAATSNEEKRSSTGGGQAAATQHQEELKSRIVRSIKDLPPMPQVVIKIQHLVSDVNSDASKLAEIIESDQAIAAKVLKMANSAFYGMSGRISSIRQASLLLGYQTLGEIVTMAGTAANLSGAMPGYGYDSQELWKHSLSVAFSAKMIAEMKNAYITALAKKMNISKAAVSQTAGRLERKGLVVKTVASDNKSKYILHLTEKGLRAHEEHMKIEREGRKMMLQAADILPTEDLKKTEEFLGAVRDNLLEWMKNIKKKIK